MRTTGEDLLGRAKRTRPSRRTTGTIRFFEDADSTDGENAEHDSSGCGQSQSSVESDVDMTPVDDIDESDFNNWVLRLVVSPFP